MAETMERFLSPVREGVGDEKEAGATGELPMMFGSKDSRQAVQKPVVIEGMPAPEVKQGAEVRADVRLPPCPGAGREWFRG
jgi:hypothetical protein